MSRISRRKQVDMNLHDVDVDNDVELVRMEMNLTNMGYFSAHDPRHGEKQDVQRRRIDKYDTRRGVHTSVEFKATIGLPGTACQDKWEALSQIIQERKKATNVLNNPIVFSGAEMIRILKLVPGGRIYDDIRSWCERLSTTAIVSNGVIYRAATKEWATMVTQVFGGFRSSGRSGLDGGGVTETFEVDLKDWLLESINAGYSVPQDLQAYLTLTRPIAKGIFNLLHIWFYASKSKSVEKDYVQLCKHLNVTSYNYQSKIRETMGKSLDEFITIGYLQAWDVQRMTGKPGFKIVMHVGPELLKVMSQRKPKLPPVCEPPAIAQHGMVQELINHRVHPTRALALCKKYDETYLKNHLANHAKTLAEDVTGSIKNPAGLLVSAITSGQSVPAPAPYKTIEAKPEPAHAPLEAQQREYREWIEDEADRAVLERYEPAALRHELEQLFAEHCKGPNGEQVRKIPAGKRGRAMLPLLRKRVASEVKLPSFEQWLSNNRQGQLAL